MNATSITQGEVPKILVQMCEIGQINRVLTPLFLFPSLFKNSWITGITLIDTTPTAVVFMESWVTWTPPIS